MNTKLHLCLLLSLGLICFQAQAQGLLDKVKDKVKDKSKDIKNDAKNIAKDETKAAADKQLEEIRNSYDSTSFSFAIALSDNTGLFEVKEKDKQFQRLSVSFSDALGYTKDQITDPLKKAKTANEFGQFSYANYKFRRADFFYKISRTEFEKNGATTDLQYAKLISNMGLLYQTMGRYGESEEYSNYALELNKTIFGTAHTAYGVSLNNLSMLYRNLGKYNESESFINQALKVMETTQGKKSTPYAIVLNNKAMLFQTIGRYAEAEKLMIETLAIAQETMGREKSNNYQKLLVNLALLYQEQTKYVEAEKIYKEAIDLKEKRLGTRNHPDLAHMLNLLASLYVEMGKIDQVEALLKEALRIYQVKFGPEHPAYASTASNLGNLYRIQDKLTESEEWLNKALSIRQNALGEKHPEYAQSQEDLAILYWQKGNHTQASQLYKQVLERSNEFIRAYFPPMSEAEKEKYWNKLRPTYLRFYSFVADFADKDPSLITEMYDAHLATKAILLTASSKIRTAIMNTNDQPLITDYKNWVGLKEDIAQLYAYSKEELKEQSVNLDSMETAANALEKKISQRVPELFSEKVSYQDIKSTLGTDEAVLDVIQFNHFDKKFTDQIHYVALIADQGSTNPKFVLLQNGNEMDSKYFKYYRNMIKTQKPDKYTYEQYWSKIEPQLQGKKTIYASLDGVYNQIGMNTILKPDGKYLVDEKNFVFLTNTKDLLKYKKKTANTATTKNVSLLGYPFYGTTGKIAALPGTKTEVDAIDLLLRNSGFQTKKYMGKEASEEALKKINSPRVLHIATHGFFLDDAVDTGNQKVFGIEIDKARENPLLRAGLMLANAESALDGRNTRELSSTDNGILTAYEAMNMSLDYTELVILSACETGLGEVKAGEGVYGLQRAFQVAGTDAIIMSLWTVSDAATQELMTLFYKNWLQSGDKVSAFKKAQIQLKTKYPAPYYWGAFVLIGS